MLTGFLDTEGKLHECERWEHLDLAYEIVDNLGVFVRNRLEAEDYLQKLGWIVVRMNDVYGLIGCFKDESKDIRYHLTEEQKNWLNENYKDMTKSCRESIDELFHWDRR